MRFWTSGEPDEETRRFIASRYDPHTWRMGRCYLKLGPLTLYAYRGGMGWTWMAGPGHEVQWGSGA